MYQFGFGVDNSHISWFIAIEDIFKRKVNACGGVIAYSRTDSRTFVTVACEQDNKRKVLTAVKDCFVEMYAVAVKLDYIRSRLKICGLDEARYNILLHTLVAFDRENERDFITRNLNLKDKMMLDGVFNFTLGELKKRWEDTCKLTTENAQYILDNDTYNELLKFLISAVNPKIIKLILSDNGDTYHLIGGDTTAFFAEVTGAQQLMYYLIDIAPLELVINGRMKDPALENRIVNMFETKVTNRRT